jgi:hypothetical protein
LILAKCAEAYFHYARLTPSKRAADAIGAASYPL